IHVNFYDANGKFLKKCEAKGKENLMRLGQANDIEIEAACEGSLACTTCHVYVEDEECMNNIEKASE
ncbi:MAG: mitochondrial matrix iron-sulfur protein, partial [Paramarteilia canceri]